jgi:hypothetical protein
MDKERIREIVEEEAKKLLAEQLDIYNELVQQYATEIQCADVEILRKFLHEKKFLVAPTLDEGEIEGAAYVINHVIETIDETEESLQGLRVHAFPNNPTYIVEAPLKRAVLKTGNAVVKEVRVSRGGRYYEIVLDGVADVKKHTMEKAKRELAAMDKAEVEYLEKIESFKRRRVELDSILQ